MKTPTSIEYTVGEPMAGTKWVVRGKLGQGGMGLVLSVEKAGIIRGAMKVLLPSFAKQAEYAEKFLGEVKVGGADRRGPLPRPLARAVARS